MRHLPTVHAEVIIGVGQIGSIEPDTLTGILFSLRSTFCPQLSDRGHQADYSREYYHWYDGPFIAA